MVVPGGSLRWGQVTWWERSTCHLRHLAFDGSRVGATSSFGIDPGRQILDMQTKLITHATRTDAFNTATALARAIRVHTGYTLGDQLTL